MENISDTFKNTLDNNTPCYVKKIILNARYFEDGQDIYGADADITNKLIEITPIKWKLDTEGYNVWNASTATLTLDNTAEQFCPGQKFFPSGCFLHKSKIAVHAGIINSSSNKETLSVFEGYVMADPVFSPEDKTVNITISSRLSTLSEISAEDICLECTKEQLAKKDSLNFYTANTAVREIKNLYKGTSISAAVLLRQGIDYSVSDQNTYACTAKILLKEAASASENLWADYVYNYEDCSVEWIVAKVADKASAASRQIDPVYFDTKVTNTFEENSVTGFNGECEGTIIENNKVTLPSNFPDPINVTWTSQELPSGVYWSFGENSAALLGNNMMSGFASAASSQPNAFGTWKFKFGLRWSHPGDSFASYQFIASSTYRTSSSGYAFAAGRTSGNYVTVAMYRVANGSYLLLGTAKTLYWGIAVTDIEVIISRTNTGIFKLWIRVIEPTISSWYAIDVGTDIVYSSSVYQIVNFKEYGYNQYITDMRCSPFAASSYNEIAPQGDYISPIIDAGEYFIDWKSCAAEETLPSGTSSSLFLRSKNNISDSWSSWKTASTSVFAGCADRYVQVKWTVFSNGTELPYLNTLRVCWYTLGANIAVLNTRGLTCLECLKELALMTAYEIGFDRRGKFLFRKRNTDTSDAYTLNFNDIYSVESVLPGADAVYNNISVEYGDYITSVNPKTEEEPSPHSQDKYGVRSYEISSGAFLPVACADITLPLASTVYEYLKNAKKRVVVVTKFLPQIELGDIVTLEYNMSDIPLGQSAMARGIFFRVEGIELDLENWQTRLDLTEVL